MLLSILLPLTTTTVITTTLIHTLNNYHNHSYYLHSGKLEPPANEATQENPPQYLQGPVEPGTPSVIQSRYTPGKQLQCWGVVMDGWIN